MDFIDQVQALAARVQKQLPHLQTEEATKNALVMPFINALGYNVFDPTEVLPEFTADFGIKRGEKIDYAIFKDGELVMLVECKAHGTNLAKAHASQLYRYFSVTSARIGVLTNGGVYRFYSDLEEPNKMDQKPFLEFDIFDIQPALVPEVKKLTKPHFDVEEIEESAGELKFTREIKRLLAAQLVEPDDDFVRFFACRVYSGRLTKGVREQFTAITRRAFRQFLADQVDERLKSALERSEEERDEELTEHAEEPEGVEDDGIETTPEEVEGFHIVRAILAKEVDPARIAARDVKSYFGVLLDDNNRKPLARLRFNTANKYIGLFDNPDRVEDRVPITSLRDIYPLAERLRQTAQMYDRPDRSG